MWPDQGEQNAGDTDGKTTSTDDQPHSQKMRICQSDLRLSW